MILDGGQVGLPKLQFKDGSVSVMTITDTGIAGDIHAVVSLAGPKHSHVQCAIMLRR